jgi:hypothetical protein
VLVIDDFIIGYDLLHFLLHFRFLWTPLARQSLSGRAVIRKSCKLTLEMTGMWEDLQ